MRSSLATRARYRLGSFGIRSSAQHGPLYDEFVAVDVCAVVVTYNSAHVIAALLDSIPGSATSVSVETIVVDNGSSDRTLDVLRGRSDCRVIASSNEGYAGGLMRGIRESSGAKSVLVLNPDVRLAPGSIDAMFEALSEPGTGVVVPMVRSDDGSLYHSLRREPSLPRALGLNRTGWPIFAEYVSDPDAYASACIVDWALGAVMLMSAACLEATDGWDVSYFLYSEETDFCLRARDEGFVTRYEPRARAVHIGGQSGQNEWTHSMQIVNRVRLYRRRHGTVASWAYYFLTVLSELTWAVRAGRKSRAAVLALLVPGRRPPQLGCSHQLMPS